MSSISKSFNDLSLVERLKALKSRPIICVDTSFSMNSDVEPGHTKYQAVIDILRGLSGSPRIWGFDTSVNPTDIETLAKGQGNGGTCLSPVLKLMKERGLKKAIIITDGEVNEYDKEESLKSLQDLKLKILYVGPGPKPEFLEKLARESGGFCDQEDLHFVEELTGKVQLLIGKETDYTIKL